ncbi:MAG: DNA methyltransferase [Candidatus Zixiibacteriota bacterium]
MSKDKSKPDPRNRLNELTNREWILFQKSWFIHNPPPRKKDTRLHPAKFPEEMIKEFLEFFTKNGQIVLDPMVGTGSSVLAAVESGRVGIGIELQEKFAKIANEQLQNCESDYQQAKEQSQIIIGDARNIDKMGLPEIDYVITSPPYWDMLHRGGKFRKERGNSSAENLIYSEDKIDIGNIDDYEDFLDSLEEIYRHVYNVMRNKAYMTVIVKNVKKGGRMYPLAWDIGKRLSKFFVLKDEKIWLQDNQRLAPYGMFYAWVSNTFHNYCLQFQKNDNR